MNTDLRRVDQKSILEDIKLFQEDSVNEIQKLIQYLINWNPGGGDDDMMHEGNNSLNHFLKHLNESIQSYLKVTRVSFIFPSLWHLTHHSSFMTSFIHFWYPEHQ